MYGGVASVGAGNCEGVLFSHEFIGALLVVASEVAVGELATIKALMSTTAGSVKDGKG